jgi:hypothetical protein
MLTLQNTITTGAASFLFALALLAGCGRPNVTIRELSGTWSVRESSYNMLPARLRNPSPQLELKGDGTFVARNLPIGPIDSASKEPTGLNGSGTWRSLEGLRIQTLTLRFEEVSGAKEITAPYGTQLLVSGTAPNLMLFFFLGDPDNSPRIEFAHTH